MLELTESDIYCPYCGEIITVLLNSEDVGQPYIEDCQVCCRPIEFMVTEGAGGELVVSVATDTE